METKENKQLKDNELEDVNGGKVVEVSYDIEIPGLQKALEGKVSGVRVDALARAIVEDDLIK